MHLFDIDVPGKIRFQESETLSPGSGLAKFETSRWIVIMCCKCSQNAYLNLTPMHWTSGHVKCTRETNKLASLKSIQPSELRESEIIADTKTNGAPL